MAAASYISLAVFFTVVAAFADGVTISIPAGSPSVLQEYLCNGSLDTNTSLDLHRGVHVITREGFCIVAGTGLMNVRITGAGKEETTVICSGKWGFGFGGITQSIIVEGLTFVHCGAIYNQSTVAVLYWNLTSSVSLINVAFYNSSGYSVLGKSLTNYAAMANVDFYGCANDSACFGAYFIYSGGGSTSSINILRCNFVGIGVGLTVLGYAAGDIRNCSFRRNKDAALYMIESDVSVYGSYFFDNVAAILAYRMVSLNVTSCGFDNNYNMDSPGAIVVRRMAERITSPVFLIHDSTFRNNTSKVGGAVFIFNLRSSVNFVISKSTFVNNKACIGAAIYAGDPHDVIGEESYNVHLVDVAVIENECIRCMDSATKGAAVYFNEINYLNVTGDSSLGSVFLGNYPQGAIQGIGANLDLSGAVSFKSNSGESGGAIYLTNDAHLSFRDGCMVNFSENTATELGGAIYIEGDQNIVTDILTYCAVHFIGQNHSITFNGNHATMAGHAIYATPIYHCQLHNILYNAFYPASPDNYSMFFKIEGSKENQILSFPVSVYLCNSSNDAANHTYPGGTLQYNATLLDYAGNVSPGVVFAHVRDVKNEVSHGIRLAPQQEVQWIPNECTTIEYQIFGQNVFVNLQLLTAQGIKPYYIPVTLQPCESGFELQNDSRGLLQCGCSKFLSSFGVTCDVNHGTVSKYGLLQWIGLGPNGIVAVANTCPLKYCSNKIAGVTLASPADICASGRIGVLCGQCPNGSSVVFGSEECLKCSNMWLLTILMYATLGALLVVALFALNINVTSGTLYGPIFYANILVVNATIFFSQTGLAPLEIIVSIINLDLGFSLCFFDGMDGLTKIGLQFVFPVYLIVIVFIIILTSRYCLSWSSTNDGSQPKSVGSRAVHVFATLIYLSYSKILRAVIDILTYTNVYLQNGTTVAVWFYDGTIKYLGGKHIVLFVLAMITSIILIVYTLALTFIPIIDMYSEKHKVCTWLNQKVSHLKPLNDAYYAPYKGKWRIWLGARLWLVVILYILGPFVGTENPSLLLSIHVILVLIFIFIQTHIMPFGELNKQRHLRKDLYNWLDLFYLLNYAILSLIVSYLYANETNSIHMKAVVGTLVGTALFVFFSTILFQTTIEKCGRLKGTNLHLNGTPQPPSKRSVIDTPADHVDFDQDTLREPLLEDSLNMQELGSIKVVTV
ncbi:hypothetical protein EMCRGX_G017180 [Ephydatia muelleri]|eukprot:Em0008g291a